jgi:uncharacterized sulfatase
LRDADQHAEYPDPNADPEPAFPTYGKLLRDAGYQTPYIGKWHCSFDTQRLNPYGFEGLVSPDPVGFNLQGTVGDRP